MLYIWKAQLLNRVLVMANSYKFPFPKNSFFQKFFPPNFFPAQKFSIPNELPNRVYHPCGPLNGKKIFNQNHQSKSSIKIINWFSIKIQTSFSPIPPHTSEYIILFSTIKIFIRTTNEVRQGEWKLFNNFQHRLCSHTELKLKGCEDF